MSPSPLVGSFRAAERIVVPVEGTDREFEAQQSAVEFAAALGAPVYAVHVAPGGQTPEAEEAVFEFVRAEAEKWGVEVSTRVVHGADVALELVDELKSRDLVIIGTRRLGGAYHVGSVAAKLARDAPCPVQIVRLP